MINTEKYKAFIFDLDNTLYSEEHYLFQAYNEISIQLSKNHFQLNYIDIKNYLIETFKREERANLFDKMIRHFDLSQKDKLHAIEILRNVKLNQKLKLFPEIQRLLNFLLNKNIEIFIATNGNKIQQQNKISQIDWANVNFSVLKFYFAVDYEPKPSPKVVYFILKDNSLKNYETLFVGDSSSDEECAKKAKIDFISVNTILCKK